MPEGCWSPCAPPRSSTPPSPARPCRVRPAIDTVLDFGESVRAAERLRDHRTEGEIVLRVV
ncbi:hypothetical protein AB0I28_23770 [Phytomonospora sp. NPDC050363]|uniref:hypothetical protein n=1 Tax=Phytomonospora sp. NPDC050363 TaxID=3155642 RepID=UPI0033EDB109